MRGMNSFSYENFNSELSTSISNNQLSLTSSMPNQQSLPIFKKYIPWTKNEDQYLTKLVVKYKSWVKIYQKFSEKYISPARRTKYQCYQRLIRVLDPSINKGIWSSQEDLQLLSALKSTQIRQWSQIAAKVPGRSDIQVRYRVKLIQQWLVKRGA
ncbi:Myb-like_DNA-binding domain-containing protein [Hexamita inflata]|uniref:Myb-like DNA-binding domain-containing protein n=1 Tax=Hexamita inflata TaxID=28002 RepID=A0AA86UDQ7_9EUKA|nr:Myb-like DNA-binding domain-containing protein [Hexamita inflata]